MARHLSPSGCNLSGCSGPVRHQFDRWKRWMTANSRRGYWFTVETGAVKRAITNERLASAGFFDLSLAYESIQSDCIGRAVYRTVRTVR